VNRLKVRKASSVPPTTSGAKRQVWTDSENLAVLLATGFLTRLLILNWFHAEITDGVLCLTYFQNHNYEIPRLTIFPLYPALLGIFTALGLVGEVSGRFLSASFGVLAIWPLYRLARRWSSPETAFLAGLAYLLSPLAWMWSLRTLPDTMFLFLFWMALERLAAVILDSDGDASLWKVAGLAFLAAGTRPEGLLLALWILLFLSRRPGGWRWAAALTAAMLGTTFWAPVQSILIHVLGAFREGSVGLDDPFSHLLSSLWVYITQPAWVFSPLLTLLAVGGLLEVVSRSDAAGKVWRRWILPILALELALKMIPTNYQDRHLLPFLPGVCILAALKFETLTQTWENHHGAWGGMWRRNALASLVLMYLMVFSVGVLVVQRDAFGDLKRNAEYLRLMPAETVTYTDEQFKTEYWSGRKVRIWDPGGERLRKGDLLVFHTLYTPRLNRLEESLFRNHRLEVIRRDQSSLLPLLTDLMMDPDLQNRATAVSRRAEAQYFETVTYRAIQDDPISQTGRNR